VKKHKMIPAGRLGVCVIGLGWGYAYHARHYSDMDDVDLYVCDLDEEKVERARQELEVAGAFPSVDEVLAADAVDAVDIALPHHLHLPVAVRAMEAGKHCMSEKPIARNLAEADAMLAAAERTGMRFAVGENYQFMADSTEARRVIDAGMIGTAFAVRVQELWRIGPRPGSWWFQQETSGGGNLISLGIHLVRTLRLLAGGAAEQVFALFADKVSPEVFLEGEDTSLLAVAFEGGVIGSLITSWATPHPGPWARFAVYGTEGSIVSEGKSEALVVHSRRIRGIEPAEGELRIDLRGHEYRDSFATECREFVDWLREDRDSPLDAREGRNDLEIVEAAYRSAACAGAVRLPLGTEGAEP
jgi:predicted dehydrogenase